MIKIDEFKKILKDVLKLEIEESEDCLSIEHQGNNYSMTKSNFNELAKNLSSKSTEETLMYDDNSFEILTKGGEWRLSLRDEVKKEDYANGLVYEYKSCSHEYLLFMLKKVHELGLTSSLRNRSLSRIRRLGPQFDESGTEAVSLIEFIKNCFPYIETIRINATHNRSIKEFDQLCNGFLFQLGYNLDTAVVEVRFLNEFLRLNRVKRMRRSTFEEMEAPKRKYLTDLVYHYQMALSIESPMLQFLSYYHVIEHFFEKIYEEDLIKLIEKEITNPAFSTKRDKDIKKLIKIISNKIKIRGNDFAFNEQEALNLTLLKYIDLEELKRKLNEYDESLIDNYKNNKVSFSKGDAVDLDVNEGQTFFKLANRIYKTRNSIVHNKEGEKSKFTPFTDDKNLITEIPLLRFIAEDIIIETSTSI